MPSHRAPNVTISGVLRYLPTENYSGFSRAWTALATLSGYICPPVYIEKEQRSKFKGPTTTGLSKGIVRLSVKALNQRVLRGRGLG